MISSEIFSTNIKNNSLNRWIDETNGTNPGTYQPGFQDLTSLSVFIFFLEFFFTIAQKTSISHLIVRFGSWSYDCLPHLGAHEKSPLFILGKDRPKIGHGHHLLSLSAIFFLSLCLPLSICSFRFPLSSLLPFLEMKWRLCVMLGRMGEEQKGRKWQKKKRVAPEGWINCLPKTARSFIDCPPLSNNDCTSFLILNASESFR